MTSTRDTVYIYSMGCRCWLLLYQQAPVQANTSCTAPDSRHIVQQHRHALGYACLPAHVCVPQVSGKYVDVPRPVDMAALFTVGGVSSTGYMFPFKMGAEVTIQVGQVVCVVCSLTVLEGCCSASRAAPCVACVCARRGACTC